MQLHSFSARTKNRKGAYVGRGGKRDDVGRAVFRLFQAGELGLDLADLPFEPHQARRMVRHRAVELVAGRATLEASGSIGPRTLQEIASTGVQFVSIGALTHSAPALDLSMTLVTREA